MPEVVIHAAFGGFGPFHLGCGHDHGLFDEEARDCPALIEAARERGSPYQVVSVPDDARWYVHEYDGFECVKEGREWPGGRYCDGNGPQGRPPQ